MIFYANLTFLGMTKEISLFDKYIQRVVYHTFACVLIIKYRVLCRDHLFLASHASQWHGLYFPLSQLLKGRLKATLINYLKLYNVLKESERHRPTLKGANWWNFHYLICVCGKRQLLVEDFVYFASSYKSNSTNKSRKWRYLKNQSLFLNLTMGTQHEPMVKPA